MYDARFSRLISEKSSRLHSSIAILGLQTGSYATGPLKGVMARNQHHKNSMVFLLAIKMCQLSTVFKSVTIFLQRIIVDITNQPLGIALE